MRCAVYGCCVNNDKSKNKIGNEDISYHSFPKQSKMCKQWVFLCRRKDKFNTKTARICGKHFKKSDFVINPLYEQYGIVLKTTKIAVPSLLLPLQKDEEVTSPRDLRIQNRLLIPSVALIVQDKENIELEVPAENLFLPKQCDCSTQTDASKVDCGTQVKPLMVDCSTQTAEIIPTYSQLLEQIAKLKAENWKQQQTIDSVGHIFAKGQLRKLECPQKRAKWSSDDIANAIAIHAAGPRAYRLLLRKQYPLPAVITLKKWCSKLEVYPGIVQSVLNIMKNIDMEEIDRICVLSFDEMKVKEKIVYDKRKDETLKAAKYVQVAMIRGLFGNWKQPIFYDFDQRMTKQILFSIIHQLSVCGFKVCAIVCDLGGTNQGLLRELEITVTKSFFQNPTDESRKVYVFADVPHLMKLIRNNFIDNGGFILDGQLISKGIIEELISKTNDKSDLSIAYKISLTNLYVKGAERQKVKLATKLFSHTVSQAIMRAGSLGELSSEGWLKCSVFFKQVNDWFDCLNVRVPYQDSRERVQGVGLSESLQFGIVDEMTSVMLNMRVKGKRTMMPFQKGIIMTNNSLKLLYNDLKTEYNISYLLTYRLNQDVLENFFGTIRSKGGLYDHPNRLEFMYRLRSYILGRNEGSLSMNGNSLVDNTPDLEGMGYLSSTLLKALNPDFIATEEPADELESLQYDGLEHLAGYICHRINNPDLAVQNTQQETSFTWTNQLTEGFLQKPRDEMMVNMEKMEAIFKIFNKDDLIYCRNYLKQLLNLSKDIPSERKVKEIFFRSRMYFRIKHLNNKIEDNLTTRKRKMIKTIL